MGTSLARYCIALAAGCLSAAMLATPAKGAEADWQGFLRRDAFESIEISPDGKHLATAERNAEGTVVVIRDTRTLQEKLRFDPGELGEVAVLRWLDDDRLVIGANRADSRYRVALAAPALYVVGRDGRSKERMPANFLATIEGDPDHLLVTSCTRWVKGGCIDEVKRAEVGHTKYLGETVISAPDAKSGLIADQHGQVRFAISWNDSSQSRLHVHRNKNDGWQLVNDAAATGVDSIPLGLDEDGSHAYLLTERKRGTSIIERYAIADGKRQDVYADKASDPLWPIYSLDGNVPLGAYYEATRPRPVIWNTSHPDVAAVKQILGAFPQKMVRIASATKDGNLVVVRIGSDQDPGSYYLFDRAAKKASLLTRARPWLAKKTLPTTEPFVLKARDGVTLHGLITLPANTASVGLPMVVVPHGGPYEVTETQGYDAEAALLASQGYAVLRVNFRGSGGYGRDFVELGYMQWGRAMQDDVTDATRWAIEQGYADPKRVCLYGSSYGGYAALMGAVREPGLYRCVAGYAAPYDLAKMYKWGSIRRSDLGLKYLERVIGKDKAELGARSPSLQAASIKIPVLLAHGKLDARVGIEHSRTMAKAMRKAGADVDLVEYPNEGHGLAIEADKVDFYTRLLAFLKQHTQ